MTRITVLLPFVCFFGLLALGYPVGRAGWVWLPRLFCAGLILAIIVLTVRWAHMPSGLDRVIYLVVALFLILPALLGALLGVWLGRRRVGG